MKRPKRKSLKMNLKNLKKKMTKNLKMIIFFSKMITTTNP